MLRGIGFALALITAPMAAAADVTVFAASSLKTALDDAVMRWSAATGGTVTVAYGATSALARQIEAGAPADVFLAASPDWMDDAERAGALRPGTRRDLFGNALVLVAPGAGDAAPVVIGRDFDLAARLGDGRLAMALVDAVPAGVYGKAALTSLGLWDAVAPRVAQADNVRAALALVARGAAPLGVVYATDAVAEPAVHVAGTFPDASHPPIVYPGAVTAGSTSDEALAFLDWLGTEAGMAAFAGQGFQVLR